MSALDEILSELRSSDAYDAKLAEKLATEFAELKEYERLYNLVARDLNSANFRLSEISKFVYQESGLTQHEADAIHAERESIAAFIDYAFEHSWVVEDVLNAIKTGNYVNFKHKPSV